MEAATTYTSTAIPQLNLWWVMLAPLFPLLGFALLALLPRELRNALRFVPIVGLALSFIIAVAAAVIIWPGGAIGQSFYTFSWTLGTVGAIPLTLSFAVDSLAVIMLIMVSLVGLCVQIYSLNYMKDDERVGWFFCIKSLFLAAMLGFVLSGGLLLQFAFWEIMGVCSYALIGFWYRNKAPRKAAQKAFLVTRAGDVGFFIALSAVFVGAQSFEFDQIFASAPSWSPALLTVVVLGLIWAAIGKSAQFPLSAWLPNAMAGPTPGSALIHAATMVVAGVFMLIRMLPVLELSPLAMNIILSVGIITALYGGLLACFQTDLKKLLAFSTISQLGFLFAAVGVGAAFVATFHMTTHAFFKALLFLAAGILIHATKTQDMREMGTMVKRMPLTFISFTIGAFALAGLIPLAGFFSKDEIFKAMLYFGRDTGHYFAFVGVLLVGSMTAFYVVKSWLTIFRGSGEKEGKAYEGRSLELAPVIFLALLSVVAGFAVIPFGNFLDYPASWPSLYMIIISTVVMFVGALLGFWAFALRGTLDKVLGRRFNFITEAAEQSFYLDALYQYALIKPYFWLSEALWKFDMKVIDGIVNGTTRLYVIKAHAAAWFDEYIVDGIVNGVSWSYVLLTRLLRVFDVRIIDGFVNGLGQLSVALGLRLRSVQSGEVHWYQRLMLGAGIVIVGIFVILYVVSL